MCVRLGHASTTVEVSAIQDGGEVPWAVRCWTVPWPRPRSTAMRKNPEMQKRRRGQAVPIRWAKADAAACLAEAEGSVIGLRDAAIFAVMSDALLRLSELVALDCEHVTDEEDGSGRVLVARSKTDQVGRGVWLYLGTSTVKRVRAWQSASGIAVGPMFRRMRRGGNVQPTRLTTRGLNLIIRRRAEAAGVKGASGHSFRVGAAQSLAARGASVVEMQAVGRWADPRMPGRYSEAQRAGRGAVARLRYPDEAQP